MIWRILGYIVLFLLSFVGGAYLSVITAFSGHKRFTRVRYNGRILKDQPVTEKTTGYDLYLPEEKKDAYGLILYIHGGGFTGGDKKEGTDWCRFYAAHGYVAATMNYTLATKKTTSDLNRMDREVLATVRAIQTQCETLAFPLHSMATTGSSAGGCLALLFAYRHKDDSPVPVRCVFEQTGPVLFEPEGWGNGDDGAKASFVAMMSGKPVTKEMIRDGSYRKIVDEISPARLVVSDSVPTLCAYGPKDKIVPPPLKFALLEALEKNGVPHVYIEFPHSNHGMYSDPKQMQRYVQESLAFVKTYVA